MAEHISGTLKRVMAQHIQLRPVLLELLDTGSWARRWTLLTLLERSVRLMLTDRYRVLRQNPDSAAERDLERDAFLLMEGIAAMREDPVRSAFRISLHRFLDTLQQCDSRAGRSVDPNVVADTAHREVGEHMTLLDSETVAA